MPTLVAEDGWQTNVIQGADLAIEANLATVVLSSGGYGGGGNQWGYNNRTGELPATIILCQPDRVRI